MVTEYTHTHLDANTRLFKGLADETRLRILGLLRHGELCVCDIMEVLALPQSTASRHLAYLKNSGWITGNRKGKWMYYTLLPPAENDIRSAIITHLAGIDQLEDDSVKMRVHLEKKTTSCS